MNTRHKAGTLAGTAALTVALALSTAPTQGAAPMVKAKPKCPKKALCVWADENYQGQRVVVKGKKVSNKILDEMNDQASSAFLNRQNQVGVLWANSDGEGEAVCLFGENKRRFRSIPDNLNNGVSSSSVQRGIENCTL